MAGTKVPSSTRDHILRAALKSFAECGYAAASVQRIVTDAKVSKPSLYYYFKDKAALFGALVERAHAERFELLRKAAEGADTIESKLEEMAAAYFEYALQNRALVRLAFATAFASAGEVPAHAKCHECGRRIFDLIRDVILAEQNSGALSKDFTPDELAMGYFSQLNTYVMVRLIAPEWPLDRPAARRIVRLFLDGAQGKVHGSVSGKARNGRRISRR